MNGIYHLRNIALNKCIFSQIISRMFRTRGGTDCIIIATAFAIHNATAVTTKVHCVSYKYIANCQRLIVNLEDLLDRQKMQKGCSEN